MTHRLRAAVLGVLVAVLALTGAIPAAAHNELVGSTPPDGAIVAAAPREVVLEFDQPVQAQFSQVVVLDGVDGHHERGEPLIEGATITQGLGNLPPGVYRISYRVGSADGHPITGTLTFTVAAAATPTTEPTSAPSPDPHEGHPTPAAAGTTNQTGTTSGLLVTGGGIVAAVVLGAVLYVVMAGRRSDEPPGPADAETGRR
jgi:copper resistance protein C